MRDEKNYTLTYSWKQSYPTWTTPVQPEPIEDLGDLTEAKALLERIAAL